MGRTSDLAPVAATVQLHGTAWLGVAGAALGLALTVVAVVRARRRVAVGVALAGSAAALVLMVAVLGGSLIVIPVGLAGQLLVGAVAGRLVGADRWRYLAAAGGCLLLVLFGEVVLLSQGAQSSDDLFALGLVPVIAFLLWLPLVLGAWISEPDEDDRPADDPAPRRRSTP